MERPLAYAYSANRLVGSREVAEGAIKEFAEEQAGLVGVNIDWDVDRRQVVGEGLVDDFPVSQDLDSHRFPVLSGVADLALDGSKEAGVTALALVKGLIAVRHEVDHCRETKAQLTDVSDTVVGWSLSYLATVKNPRFYHEYYTCNKREMTAEYMALREVRPRLEELFTKDETEKLIFEYVAWRTLPDKVPDGPDDHETRVVYPRYFIPPADTENEYYESMKDVEKAFEMALSVEYPGQYCTWPVLCPAPGHILRDEFVRVMEPRMRDNPWSAIFEKFQGAGSQVESYKMLASLTCYLHPKYKDCFGNLKDVDLSPKAVFGMPFPETPEKIQERLDKEEAKIRASSEADWCPLLRKLRVWIKRRIGWVILRGSD